MLLSPFLSTLLEHTDFQEGIHDGIQAFQTGLFTEDHHKVWTEDEMITFVMEEISETRYRNSYELEEAIGLVPLSYLHHLGFTIGYLDQALATKAEA